MSISRQQRFIDSKCDRCGKATHSRNQEVGELFTLPHEWGAPCADVGSFCQPCIDRYSKEDWAAWVADASQSGGGRTMITVANIRTTKDGEYIGRAMPRQGLKASPLGNPYRVGDMSREQALTLYAEWLDGWMQVDSPQLREMLRLANLAHVGHLTLLCWCFPQACHGDIVRSRIEAMLVGPA